MFNPRIGGAGNWSGEGLGAVSGVSVSGSLTLFTVIAYNNTGADRYIQIFTTTTAQVNGATPSLPPVRVPANTDGSVDFGVSGRHMTGLQVLVSTTAATLTLGGNDCFLDVGYRKRG